MLPSALAWPEPEPTDGSGSEEKGDAAGGGSVGSSVNAGFEERWNGSVMWCVRCGINVDPFDTTAVRVWVW